MQATNLQCQALLVPGKNENDSSLRISTGSKHHVPYVNASGYFTFKQTYETIYYLVSLSRKMPDKQFPNSQSNCKG
jgi:hypothetical protein